MSNLRSTLNPEEMPGVILGPSPYRIGMNQFELRCGLCGTVYFVDHAAVDCVREAIVQGLDNPFRCVDCEEEYDESVYDG